MMPGLALSFGFLAASAALLAQVFLAVFFTDLLTAPLSLIPLIGAAVVEEGARLAFLIQLERRLGEPLSLLSVLLFGIGFVIVEGTLLALSAPFPGLQVLGMVAGVHILGTLIIAGGLRFRTQIPYSLSLSFLSALLIHTLYNTSR